MKVLIVDDNADDRKLLRLIFERHGYTNIIEACDGHEGLDMARAQRPDLIISDALMPRLDGFQFLWTLKMVEDLRNIPFVFYSAVYTGLKDEELASRLGAEGFITRPKEPEEFWREMSAILEKLAVGKRKPHTPRLMEGERDFLRKYCEIVTGKLEEKVRELEETLARRKAAEEELIANQERLKTLAAELAHAEERERYRIAIELHDAVGQRLAQSRMMLDALTKIPISPECIGRIDKIRGILDTVIDQIRSLIFRISPPVLYIVGFEAAVESLCEKFQEDFGIRVTFTNDGKSRTIAEDLRGGLYRMVQELLFNAVKHARAKTVAVSVKSVESCVDICVEDDGCGFDTSRLFQYRDKKICLGLFSIKERTEYLGGSMKIDSKPGHGTCVNLIVPI
jgi:signal transduction histidine kinase